MKPDIKSRILLAEILKEFNEFKNKTSNKEYLEFQIGKLERTRTAYESNSKNPKLKPRDRARARDYAQNLSGIVAGIKFSLSFLAFDDSDLIKLEGLDLIREGKNDRVSPN